MKHCIKSVLLYPIRGLNSVLFNYDLYSVGFADWLVHFDRFSIATFYTSLDVGISDAS